MEESNPMANLTPRIVCKFSTFCASTAALRRQTFATWANHSQFRNVPLLKSLW
jgi:hypothetical protein